MNLPDLHAQVLANDPETGRRLHPGDRFRLARALEVYRATGRPLSSFEASPPDFPFRHATLVPERAELRARIEARVSEMEEAGWADEVRGLARRFGPDLPLLDTLGYRQWMDILFRNREPGEAKAEIANRTWQFARRQLSWFRHEADAVPWAMEVGQTADELAGRLLDWMYDPEPGSPERPIDA